MRRILLSCTLLALLALPVASSARATGSTKPGFLVVRGAANDGGVHGSPVATVVVKGFVLGRISQEARVAIYQLPSAGNQAGPQVKGADVSTKAIRAGRFTGKQFSGSDFRFRAMGGSFYRIVVRGSGVYLFAGGQGSVKLRGSSIYRHADGVYSVNGSPFRSLPGRQVKLKLGGG